MNEEHKEDLKDIRSEVIVKEILKIYYHFGNKPYNGSSKKLYKHSAKDEFAVYPLPHGWNAKFVIELYKEKVFGESSIKVLSIWLMFSCSDWSSYSAEYSTRIKHGIEKGEVVELTRIMDQINLEINEKLIGTKISDGDM